MKLSAAIGFLKYGLLIVIISGCGTAKHTAIFKSNKKTIDTLLIIEPYVQVIADDYESQLIDSELTKANETLILKTTNTLLQSKYIFKQTAPLNINKDSLISLCDRLDKSEKIINDVAVDKVFSKSEAFSSCQYGLSLIFHSRFNPRYEPNYNVKMSMAASGIYYNPSTKPYSDLIVMVIDLKTMELVYYDREKSSNIDPRLSTQIEQMVKTRLRPIYYK